MKLRVMLIGLNLELLDLGSGLGLDNSYFRRNKSNTIERVLEKNIQVTYIILFHKSLVQFYSKLQRYRIISFQLKAKTFSIWVR